MSGLALLGFSALFFLFIITFGKPVIINCWGCQFTFWEILVYPTNQASLFLDGLIVIVGAALLIGYRSDTRQKFTSNQPGTS